MLVGRRILVTGPTGQVGFVVAKALSKDNEVWGLARFSDRRKRLALEEAGIRCVTADLGSGDLSGLPDDFDYVIHLAHYRGASNDFDAAVRNNAEATGLLMSHCRSAKGFLACSTTGVYRSDAHNRLKETGRLGHNITKLATESVARFACRAFDLPTVIPRLCVPYGANGGWPYNHLLSVKHGRSIRLHPDRPSIYSLIHEDDIVATIPALLNSASVPATVVNWGGTEVVAIEEWTAYMGDLVGAEPILEYTEMDTLESRVIDPTKMLSITGPFGVHWKDGIRRMIVARHADWLV